MKNRHLQRVSIVCAHTCVYDLINVIVPSCTRRTRDVSSLRRRSTELAFPLFGQCALASRRARLGRHQRIVVIRLTQCDVIAVRADQTINGGRFVVGDIIARWQHCRLRFAALHHLALTSACNKQRSHRVLRTAQENTGAHELLRIIVCCTSTCTCTLKGDTCTNIMNSAKRKRSCTKFQPIANKKTNRSSSSRSRCSRSSRSITDSPATLLGTT